MFDKLIFYLFGGVFLLLVLAEYIRFKLRKTDFKHFFKWGSFWLGIAFIFIFSNSISFAIKYIGIKLPFNFITILGFIIILIILWNIYIRIERIEEQFRKLIQQIALKDDE